ncbi:MAG TPA: hypothetical protein VFA71_02500 [Terriglobales bacterium]|nr:hypothetical protein [Terriglobales bacterium]
MASLWLRDSQLQSTKKANFQGTFKGTTSECGWHNDAPQFPKNQDLIPKAVFRRGLTRSNADQEQRIVSESRIGWRSNCVRNGELTVAGGWNALNTEVLVSDERFSSFSPYRMRVPKSAVFGNKRLFSFVFNVGQVLCFIRELFRSVVYDEAGSL